MSSFTGNLNSLQENHLQNTSSSAVNTTEKKKCHRRKIFALTPLRLDEIAKELREAQQGPATSAKPPVDFDENDEKEVNSFDLEEGISALTLFTPAKKIKQYSITPHIEPKSNIIGPPDKIKKALEYQYRTPKHMPPPKVQCSVNMQNYIRTPIDKLCASRTLPVQRSVQKTKDCDSLIESSPKRNPTDETFKKLLVNNVQYIVLNELGKGGSSEVFHCYNVSTKLHCAIKCVSLHNSLSAQGFINEVKVLQTLQECKRIVKMYDYEINESLKTLLVVLELGGTDLSKILKESLADSSHIPLYMLICYWMEMLYAVKEIHTHGIIHSDLKPANFLKVNGFLKLIDFGISSCIQLDMTSVIKPMAEGSFNYISPEAVNSEQTSNSAQPRFKISYKSDVWSLGCILYQLVYRRTPFQHINQMWGKLHAIADPNHKIEYPEAKWVPRKILDTMKSCLQYQMKLRPSVDDLIADYENAMQNI